MATSDHKIIPGNWDSYLTHPGEKLLLVMRQHWLTLLTPLSISALLGVFFLVFFLSIFWWFIGSLPLAVFFSALLLLVLVNIMVKSVIDWYYHFFIVTNRKVQEITYVPLSSHDTNDILLDQVRCTEIDVRRDGLFNTVFDMGNIVMTFDRPTHQAEFVLTNISDPRSISQILCKELLDDQGELTNAHWFKEAKTGKWRFSTDIFPINAR